MADSDGRNTSQKDSIEGTLRRRALDSARKLLVSGGIDRLQIRALASELGCGVASLYYHFSNKDELLAAVACEGFADLRRAVDEARNANATRPVSAASEAYLRFVQSNLQLYAMMHKEGILANFEEARLAERAAFESFRQAVEADPFYHPDNADQMAFVFWALGRGIASLILTQGDDDPGAAMRHLQTVRSALTLFRNGGVEEGGVADKS